MDICRLIMQILDEKGKVRASEIVKTTGFSRAYVNRFFQSLRDEGKIILLGKANKARYVQASRKSMIRAKKDIISVHRILQNKGLSEDLVLAELKKSTGILLEIQENVSRILDYAFTEMLNNAVEHSQSKIVEVTMERGAESIRFNVIDRGVGIFNHIMRKKNLQNEMEAIQDLLKGKLSTAPKTHSGEGIFFTSKIADILIIKSSKKKIIFNNLLDDLFIRDIKGTAGTKITFSISLDSKRELSAVFKHSTDDSFEFSKTKVTVKLYKMGSEYISRSQARRILSGLDKFKTITLNFKGVEMIGQGFADEVFHIWKLRYPKITIIPQNTNENIRFMINRAYSRHEEQGDK